MGDIQNWYLDLINVAMIAMLVSIIVALFIYSMIQSIRDVSPALMIPVTSRSIVKIDANRRDHRN